MIMNLLNYQRNNHHPYNLIHLIVAINLLITFTSARPLILFKQSPQSKSFISSSSSSSSSSSVPMKKTKPLKESPIFFITTRLAKPKPFVSSVLSSSSSASASAVASSAAASLASSLSSILFNKPLVVDNHDNKSNNKVLIQSSQSPPRKTYYQSMDKINNPTNLLSSTIYKLPLKFISNAKPIDIITGFTKHHGAQGNLINTKSKKPTHLKKPSSSNFIYLPLKYHSNGKPSKIFINKLTHKGLY
ncbi:uncharacterized protein LOC128391033 [Panonychus citri]|uniref:uncharacterized protein LOC128391033 n=1 Tax=Panonychus citri TaxID=50023 RepID=UPI00230750EB|nr:uncharacterized protein LOC128391033 [Panonychus citri]